MAILFLAGCSSIPSVGPSTSDVVQQTATTSDVRYELIDIDQPTVDILRHRRSAESLASFGDFRPSVDTRIGIGDSVSVTIWEAAAGGLFSGPLVSDRFSTGSNSSTLPEQIVGSDGSISVPYAGRIHVANRTTAQVQGVIEAALQGKAIQPQVLVNVTRPVSNTVTVVGDSSGGAVVPLSVKGNRVLDVIAAAGGIRTPVNETYVELARGGRVVAVPLSRVTSDPHQNIFLRPNDTLTLRHDPQMFMAYGATGGNAEIPFDADGINLAQALSKAGGLQDNRADPNGVFVFRFESPAVVRALRPESPLLGTNQPIKVVYRLSMRDPASLFMAQQFQILNRDLVYVSNAPLTDIQKVMQIFDMALSPAASSASIYSVSK
ncbi:MAG TPA: polysaccharide biosynthesis/export family protein [Beijerinckiaceae bacterium]|nr:polysaccharide biosynthesis/export family protein [Beijerinckiaceae bacterium]